MRITLAVAVACLAFGGLAAAGDATAAIRKQTDIPAEGLAPALNALAKDRNFQIVYVTEDIANVRTEGAVGEFTTEEALKKLLIGTGLTYRYLDDKTVTVGSAKMPRDPGESADKIASSGSPNDANANREGKKSSSGDFRVAQVDQGKGSSTSSVGEQGSTSQENPKNPSTGLEEIVVTAQKRSERLQDVPISISVLSGNALDESTTQGVLDELSRVPGVVISPPGINGLTQIAIRGVAPNSGSNSNPIAYYLDTVPFGFVDLPFVPDSNPFDLERVEVLRGPQGTLYGASAENGVVRIITNDADPTGFDLKARVLGSGTDGGGANGGGDLAVNVPIIDGKLAVRGVVGYQNQSGWIDRPGDSDANASQLRNYRLKLDYRPVDGMTIDLSYWGSRQHLDAPPLSDSNRNALDSGLSAEPMDNDFDAYGAKINYQFTHFSMTSSTSYISFRNLEEQALAPYNAFFASIPLFNLHATANLNALSEEFLLNSTDASPWRWTAGVFYRDDREKYTQVAVPCLVLSPPQCTYVGFDNYNMTSRSYAFFGELSRRFLNDKFEWTLGVRQFHDDVSQLSTDPTVPPTSSAESFHATTPRVVLSWFPNTTMTVYSSFSEGFRSGLPQNYADLEVDPNLGPVKPDKLYNYELGMKADLLNHHLGLDTSVYYIRWTDVQQAIGLIYQQGSLPATVNGPSASGPGVDFGVTARPTDRFEVGGTVSWNHLEMDDDVISVNSNNNLLQVLFPKGGRLNGSSEYTASLFANYAFPLGGGGTSGALSVSGNYTSKQSGYGLGPLGPYVNYGDNLGFVNAAFTVKFPRNWLIKLYGDNLTNEYGALSGTLVPGEAATLVETAPRPRPRTIGLEMDYRYRQ